MASVQDTLSHMTNVMYAISGALGRAGDGDIVEYEHNVRSDIQKLTSEIREIKELLQTLVQAIASREESTTF